MNQFFMRTEAWVLNPLSLNVKTEPSDLPSYAVRTRHTSSLPGSQITLRWVTTWATPRFQGGVKRWSHLLLFLVLVFSVPLAARAQDGRVITDDEVNEIAHKLYCPVCENITLDTCGTAACADWRYEIRLQLEQGKTEAEIVDDFVHRFGDRVVGTPLDPALRAVSLYTPWILIAAALIGGAVVLTKRRSTPALVVEGADRSRYADQFEQDLAD